LIVLAAAVIAVALARESGTRVVLWRWALAPQLLFYAGMNMDLLPVGLTVAAVVLARRRRSLAAMIALALGGTAKLFPALAAPAVLVRGRRPAPYLIAAFIGTVVIVFLPSAFAPHSSLAGVAFYAAGYEAGGISVWGLARAALDGLGVPDTATVVLVLTTVGLVASYVFGVVQRSRGAADPAVGVALAVIAVLFWSRLQSPQFSLWVMPFFALLPSLRRSTFILLAITDTFVFVGVSQLTLVQRDASDPAVTAFIVMLAAVAVVRHAALIRMWRDVLTAGRAPSGNL
jgi:hypothetical protein